ncbi:hypothetical protein LINPERPRIM_LOCUS32307 [Linum perenne]
MSISSSYFHELAVHALSSTLSNFSNLCLPISSYDISLSRNPTLALLIGSADFNSLLCSSSILPLSNPNFFS